MLQDIYNVPVTLMNGDISNLKAHQGKVLLIVNVASRCGFTPQYKDLQALQDAYQSQGFSVLGFPCDQFLHQEPGSNEEIKEFVDSCFRVTFPIYGKLNVKGVDRAPLYTYLAEHIEKKPLMFIPWNFTKILIDADGRVLKRFLPTASFEKIKAALLKLGLVGTP